MADENETIEQTNQEEETETEERDLIDVLIDSLNDGVDGVIFDRDVLDTDRPDDWGAVEMTGDNGAEWADGRLIDQTVTLDLWVCVSERGSRIRTDVQDVLIAFAQDHEIGFKFVSRNYLYDLNKVMWRWSVTVWGPLELPAETEPEEDPEDEPEAEPEDNAEDDPEWPDEIPFEDPEEDPENDLLDFTDADLEKDPEWPEPETGEGD